MKQMAVWMVEVFRTIIIFKNEGITALVRLRAAYLGRYHIKRDKKQVIAISLLILEINVLNILSCTFHDVNSFEYKNIATFECKNYNYDRDSVISSSYSHTSNLNYHQCYF